MLGDGDGENPGKRDRFHKLFALLLTILRPKADIHLY